MTTMLKRGMVLGALSALLATASFAVDTKLAYPEGKLSDGKDVMDQVYFVNHFFCFQKLLG
jgi:hypothetical protein